MKIKKLNILVFVLFIFLQLIFAEENKNFNFINIPISNAISLGGQSSVVDNGSFNTLTNPAMLGTTRTPILLEYNRLFYYADTYYDLVGLSAANITEGLISGIVMGRFSSGNIPVLDTEGYSTGTNIEYAITNINISFAARLGKYLWLGASGYSLWEKNNIESRFFGSNAGFMYNRNLKNKFIKHIRVGSVVYGLGLNNNLFHSEDIMVKILNTEFYYGMLSTLRNNSPKHSIGTNIYLLSNKDNSLSIRGGVSGFNSEYTKSYSAGIGIRIKDLCFDYDVSNSQYLNTIHNIKLGMKLGEPSAETYIAAINKKEKIMEEKEKKRVIKIAVLDFEGKNVSKEDASIVSDFFRTEINKTKKYTVLERSKMETILYEQKIQFSGIRNTQTAVETGKLLNTEQVVIGTVSKIKKMYYITVNFIDVKTGIIVKSESVSTRYVQQFYQAVKELVQKIISSEI